MPFNVYTVLKYNGKALLVLCSTLAQLQFKVCLSAMAAGRPAGSLVEPDTRFNGLVRFMLVMICRRLRSCSPYSGSVRMLFQRNLLTAQNR